MKRLLVLSDSHGRATDLAHICALHPEADHVIFLGDGEADVELLELSFPQLKVLAVQGNNDFFSSLPHTDTFLVNGVRVLYTHGHRSGVKGGFGQLVREAKSRGCSIVLYGHTHEARCDKLDGVYLINPGAVLSWPARFALVDITDEGYPIVSHGKLK